MIHEIQAASAEYQIEYPTVASEFEVQAFLYSELKRRGLDVRGEVKARGCFGLRKAKAACRFDLVLFQNRQAVMILEIKGAPVNHQTTMEATRQGQRYPHFGVPVWTVYGMAGAEAVIERLVG